MNAKNLKKLLKFGFEKLSSMEDFKFKKMPMILVIGKAGGGKSETIRQVADELGIGYIDKRLAQMETGDLLGLPDKENGKTIWLKPEWFPDEGTKGIIALEEINRANKDVRNAIFELILDRRLNTHELPKDWLIVSSINPTGSNYDVYELDEAFIDRCCLIKYTPETQEWLSHAVDKIDNSITDFVGKYPHLLGNEPIETPVEIKPSPRAWFFWDTIRKDLPQELQFEVLSGLVGTEPAIAYFELMKSGELPINPQDVINAYSKVRVKVKKLSKPKTSRIDLLKVTSDKLLAILDKQELDLTDEQKENLRSYLKDIPDDLSFATIKEIVKLDNKDLFSILSEDSELVDKLATARNGVDMDDD